MKLLLKLILVAVATFSVLVGLRVLGQMIHPGATHYWVAQPVASSGSSYPFPVTGGIAFWWRMDDLATNVVVTNWIDRVSGSVWTNSSVTAPTNTSGGVYFDGAQELTNSTYYLDTNMTLIVTFKRTGTGDQQDILTYNNGGAWSFMWFFGRWELWILGNHANLFGDPGGTTAYFDIAFTHSYNGVDTTTIVGYTNGVAQSTNTSVGPFQRANIVQKLGNGPDGYLKGYVCEILEYTNLVLTPSEISDTHDYLGTKYGY